MIITLFAFILVLGILVFTHELGHFLLAKKHKVRVETFSLGFGPKLFKFKKGETEYCISAIPLGGYVKLTGENPDESLTGAAYELMSIPVWRRFTIFFAGPGMNILLTIIVYIIIGIVGFQIPAYFDEKPLVVWVRDGGKAAEAGIQPNDLITHINGKPVSTWETLYDALNKHFSDNFVVRVFRNNTAVDLTLNPSVDDATGIVMTDFGPQQEVVISSINKDFPAEKAGLHPKDRIVSVNNITVFEPFTVQDQVQSNRGQAVRLTVIRENEGQKEFTVTPKFDEQSQKYLIGITFENKIDNKIRKLSVFPAIKFGFTETWDWTIRIYQSLYRLIIRKAPVSSLGGPILIAQVAGEAWRLGITKFLHFLALISLNLAIINLLPIPVLDGGHILFLIPELFTGHPVSPRMRMYAQQIGLGILLFLIAATLFIDIMRLTF